MKVGDLVSDKRCRKSNPSKSGIILAIAGKGHSRACQVLWPSDSEFPIRTHPAYWTDEDDLELINENR